MSKGKKRRRVVWRAVGLVDHCWIVGSMTSMCGAFELTASDVRGGEGECRQCRITLDQLW